MKAYKIDLAISKQEDGLWRVEAPALQGCFVDAPTLHEALSDIQEVAAMILDIDVEQGNALPDADDAGEHPQIKATIPVIIQEHSFRRIAPKKSKGSG